MKYIPVPPKSINVMASPIFDSMPLFRTITVAKTGTSKEKIVRSNKTANIAYGRFLLEMIIV